jgi:hypothetical protein
VGKKILQSKRVTPMHHSMFHRIDGIPRNHQKDYHNQTHSLGFDHLEWPVDSLDHQKDHSALDSKDNRAHFQNSSHNQCPNQLPNSNSKGKRPIDPLQDSHRSFGCSICAQSGSRATCCDWIRCHSCHQLGHVVCHYAAKWKKAGNQVSSNHMPNISSKNI